MNASDIEVKVQGHGEIKYDGEGFNVLHQVVSLEFSNAVVLHACLL